MQTETRDPISQLSLRAGEYIEGKWHEQGQQPSLVVAIPVGLPKAQALGQIADILTQVPSDLKPLPTALPKYSLHGRKRDIDSLFRYLKCVLCKAYFPDAKLWEIGVEAKLSTTYSGRLAKGIGSVDDQQALKILTSRAINRGMAIAENAARGVFPRYKQCDQAVAVNWEGLHETLEARQEWEDQQSLEGARHPA